MSPASAEFDEMLTMAPLPTRDHRRQRVLAHQHQPVEVDGEGLLPHVELGGRDRAVSRLVRGSVSAAEFTSTSTPPSSDTTVPIAASTLRSSRTSSSTANAEPASRSRAATASAASTAEIGDRHMRAPCRQGFHGRRADARRATVTTATRPVRSPSIALVHRVSLQSGPFNAIV